MAYVSSYLEKIENAQRVGFCPPADYRSQRAKLGAAKTVFESGAQFFVAVKLNTKEYAWKHQKFAPCRWHTIKKTIYKKERVRKYNRTQYDLAVRTGTWALPERDRDRILIGLDIDDWEKVSGYIKGVLARNETFVVRTQRGFHFYFYAPAYFSPSTSTPGVVDWLGKNRIVVLTGADRFVLHALPIATLSKEHAEVLYKFASHKRPPTYPRWSAGQPGDCPGKFAAIEGERNYRINGELYRLRKLTEDQLIAKALELAAQCEPPYPKKEAIAIAKSIIRNRHRFPSAGTADNLANPPPFNMSYQYTRLGEYFPHQGMRFTRAEYEAALEKAGWRRDKRGRIEIARRDIEHHLQLGEIRLVDKAESGAKGGNRAHIYERVREYSGDNQFLLPGRITSKLIRLSLMMYLLADIDQEVVRRTLRSHLGILDDSTISRYSLALQDASLWGAPLIHKQVRKPYIKDSRLNPRCYAPGEWPLPKSVYAWLCANFVEYLPSIYRRLQHYHNLLKNKQSRRANEKRSQSSPLPSPLGSNANAPYHRPCNNVAKNTTTRRQITCRACNQAYEGTDDPQFCLSCSQQRAEIEVKRQDTGLRLPQTDYCTFCHRFYIAETLPLKGVCPTCELQHFSTKAPTRALYCPNPLCGGKIHVAHYQKWQPPAACPHCQEQIPAESWRKRPPPPEEKLPGYPVNHYTSQFRTLFEIMDEYARRHDLPNYKFRQQFTTEQLTAWEAFHAAKMRTQMVYCESCRCVHPVVYHRDATPPPVRIAKCQSCQFDEWLARPLPSPAQAILDAHQQQGKDRILALYEQLFGKPARKPPELEAAVDQYNWWWVEYALRATARKPRVRYPVPHTLKILDNWAQQGHINAEDEQAGFLERRGEYLQHPGYKLRPDEAVYMAKSVYEAYDHFVAILNPILAQTLHDAVTAYGERAVRFAIAEAARMESARWSYCQKILERLKRQDRLGAV